MSQVIEIDITNDSSVKVTRIVKVLRCGIPLARRLHTTAPAHIVKVLLDATSGVEQPFQ